MLQYALEKAMGIKITVPFPRFSYAEAIARFGSDKPDLRFGMELVDITDIVSQSAFRVFAETVAKGGQVKALRVPNMATASRKELADLIEFAKHFKAKGLATFALADGEVKSQVAKFLSDRELRAIFDRCGAQRGDLVLLLADDRNCRRRVGPLAVEVRWAVGLGGDG